MTPTKTKNYLKQLMRKRKDRERHLKNVSKKIFDQYYYYYSECGSKLTKINLDFIVSEKQSTKPTMDPIEKLSGLYICPRTYATLKEVDENSKPKIINIGVTPEILLESIISTPVEIRSIFRCFLK